MAEGGIGSTDFETESVSRHKGLYSRHPQNHCESLSAEICTIMTQLGYGEEMRRWRVEKYREFDRIRNKRPKYELINDFTFITAGSKAEGLTCYLESDFDNLILLNRVVCVEAGINLHTIPDYIEVYRMDTRAYPGHCRLLQERQAPYYQYLQNALCDNGYGDVLLSSSVFLDELSSVLIPAKGFFHKRAGPSLPHTQGRYMHMDMVFALRCYCPSIIQRWAARPRHWPSPVIVKKVVSLGAYLTPVGFKGSAYKHMEWRINFNTGETELVNNLNDTQAKVYVLLKMIKKDILKPKNKEITSYTLKNIVLWQAERNPQTHFSAYSLLHWLQDGLRELRTAIAKKHMPYYMIPERNLMEACGLEDALLRKWVADITAMLEEGPGVILRLEKIRKAIIAYPEAMLWYSKKRMELEMLMLEKRKRCKKHLPLCRSTRNLELLDDSKCTLNSSDVVQLRLDQVLLVVRHRMLLEGRLVNDLKDVGEAMLM